MRPGAGRRSVGAVTLVGLLGLAGPAAAQTTGGERRAIDRAERLREGGRAAEALEALEEFLRGAPMALDALALSYELAVETGGPDRFLLMAEASVRRAPESDRARALWIRGLIAVGHADSARAAADRWVRGAPEAAEARLSLAEAHLALRDSTAAIAALRDDTGWRGSEAEVGLRLADLLVASGALPQAADVWVRLLGLDPPRISEVAADLTSLQGEGLAALAARAGREGPPVRRAAAIVALRAGAGPTARELAGGADDDALARAAFLREYAREADEAELPGEVAWAASELVGLSPRPLDRLRWRAVSADRALAAGDTATARRAFVDLAGESRPGDGPHHLATIRLFGLLAGDPTQLERAARTLEAHATAYPDSTRVRAAMHAQMALGLARAGDLETGERALVEARRRLSSDRHGPLDEAAARLALFAGARDSALARAARSLVEPELDAPGLTSRLRLFAVIEAADSTEVARVGEALRALWTSPRSFDPGPTMRAMAEHPASAGRAAALAFLAETAAEVGRPDIAMTLRRHVVERYPASAEAPGALLALARTAPADEARAWLERLIVGYPESALAPLARRMLSELQPTGT